MAVFTDNFNRANAANLGANWTNQRNSPKIVSNQASGEALSDDSIARETGTTIGADQYAQCVIVTVTANNAYVGIMARCSGTGATDDGYVIATDGSSGSGHTEIAKYVNDVYTLIAAVATTFAAADVIYIEASGTSIKAKKNGVQVGATQTDSSYASGQPGLDLYNTAVADTFEGGDLSAGAGLPFFMQSDLKSGYIASKSGGFN